MKEFTPKELREFRSAFEDTVRGLESQFGIKIDIGNISYSTGEFKTRLTAKRVLTPEEQTMKELRVEKYKQTEWEMMCIVFRLKPEWFGKTIVLQGDEYVISGLNPRAHRYPVVVSRLSDNKPFRLSAGTVIGYFRTEDIMKAPKLE